MSKLKIEIELKRLPGGEVTMVLKNKTMTLNHAAELFLKNCDAILLEAELKKAGKKSNKQLAFYYAEVLPKATAGLKDLGYHGINIDTTHEYLKLSFFPEIIENDNDMIRVSKSLSTATADELNQFVSDCIFFCETELKIKIVLPEEFKN